MSKRSVSPFVRDMLKAIGKIERYIAGMTYEDFVPYGYGAGCRGAEFGNHR